MRSASPLKQQRLPARTKQNNRPCRGFGASMREKERTKSHLIVERKILKTRTRGDVCASWAWRRAKACQRRASALDDISATKERHEPAIKRRLRRHLHLHLRLHSAPTHIHTYAGTSGARSSSGSIPPPPMMIINCVAGADPSPVGDTGTRRRRRRQRRRDCLDKLPAAQANPLNQLNQWLSTSCTLRGPSKGLANGSCNELAPG